MLSNYILNRLAAGNPAPRIDKKRCLHGMRFLSCKSCACTCPSGAIAFAKTAGKTIPVTNSNCTGCGVCAANCPSRCITLPGVSWEDLFAQARARPKLILGCSISGSTQGTEQPLPCAGALTGDFIAALSVARRFSPFAIDLSKCRTCMPKASWSLFRSLRKARAMLVPKKLPVTLFLQAGEGEQCSRRDAFSYLHRRLHHLADDLLDNQTDQPWSIHRSLLLSVLEQETETAVYLDSWKINSSCRACGRCQNLCPQKAWLIKRRPGSVQFFHDLKRCFNCKLCFKACPAAAMEKTTTPWPNHENNSCGNGKRHVRSFQAVRCHNCNRQVVQVTEKDRIENLCFICQKRTALSPGVV